MSGWVESLTIREQVGHLFIIAGSPPFSFDISVFLLREQTNNETIKKKGKKRNYSEYSIISSQKAASSLLRAAGSNAQTPHVFCVFHAYPLPLGSGIRYIGNTHKLLGI